MWLLASALQLSAQDQAPAALAPSKDAVVEMAPVVIEETSAPARLKMHFRYHVMWAGLKTLTFTDVPPSWSKAGIEVGDELVKMDGRLVEGMRLLKDLKPFMEAKFKPLRAAKADIPFVLEVRPKGKTETRTIKVILKSKTAFTLFAGL